jgi:branched-chain amino acid transport system substrate-binding protein
VAWQGKHYHLAPAFSGAPAPADRVRDLVFRDPPVVALLGPDDSDAAQTVMPLVATAHIPMLTLATVPALQGNPAPALAAPAQNATPEMIFRVRPPLVAWAREVAASVAPGSGPVVLATIGNAYGQAGEAALTSTLAAAHITPAAQVTLAPGLVDATSPITQALAARPAAIICWSTEAEAATFVRGLRAAGWQGQFILGQVDADYIALAGAAGDGTIGAMAWYPALATPASQRFVAAYTQHFGMQPDEHAAAMYDAVQILAAALAAVGPDHDALAHYLTGLSGFTGVTGTYDAAQAGAQFGTTGDLTTTLHLVRVQEGQVSEIASQP